MNHLINNNMKLTADRPAKGSVNMCAPTSSLLNPQRQSVLYISSQAVDYLSLLHILFTECRQRAAHTGVTPESCVNTQHTSEGDFCQNTGCVCVSMQAFLAWWMFGCFMRLHWKNCYCCWCFTEKPQPCTATLWVRTISDWLCQCFACLILCIMNCVHFVYQLIISKTRLLCPWHLN